MSLGCVRQGTLGRSPRPAEQLSSAEGLGARGAAGTAVRPPRAPQAATEGAERHPPGLALFGGCLRGRVRRPRHQALVRADEPRVCGPLIAQKKGNLGILQGSEIYHFSGLFFHPFPPQPGLGRKGENTLRVNSFFFLGVIFGLCFFRCRNAFLLNRRCLAGQSW